MADVVLYFTMSLDGFVAGPKVSQQDPMGVHGENLHNWMFSDKTAVDEPVISRQSGNAGAVVLGRRTFDLGLEHWGDVPYPADCFVVTHRARDPLKQKSGTFTFVTDGVAAAVAEAKNVAREKSWLSDWPTASNFNLRPCSCTVARGCSTGWKKRASDLLCAVRLWRRA
jgi:dihydrofolate reductase